MSESETPPEKKPFRFWRLVGVMSALGWSLVLPIVAGALLGKYLDRLTGQDYIWTVGLLFAGVAMSLYNLYHILFKETMD
jgi:ATP synthase protein I